MIVYHGTTRRIARRIAREGFQPKAPSRRVWFAQHSGYAKQRAHNKARRTHDRPIVLTCDIDIERLRQQYGSRRVHLNGNVISIKGSVAATVLRSHHGLASAPDSPEEIALWVNAILGVKNHNGVSRRHPGVLRMARWIDHKLSANPQANIGEKELLDRARQWLPEYFSAVDIDYEHLRVWRRNEPVPVVELPAVGGDAAEHAREAEALECLAADKAARRVRGLKLLANMDDPDLFEWCAMMLTDSDTQVRVGALKVMRQCEEIEIEIVEELALDENKRLRGAAIEVLELHGGDVAPEWFWKGLTDPETHVRLSAVKYLDRLDPHKHREVFEVALYDPHPQISQAARRLCEGMGYRKLVW